MQQLPPGDSRGAAAQQLSQGILQTDPERAFTWAASMGNDAKREEAVRSPARVAIQQAPVSENFRA